MEKTNTKHGLSVRGDSLYCPLPISYDSYWNCLTNCYNCYFRRLNHVWGKDLRPSNPESLQKKLENGLKNKNPNSILAWCLKNKKTIRIGNKTDPYQKVELKYKITQKALKVFLRLKWSFVIQTKFTENMMILSEKTILLSKAFGTIMPVISPGLEYDWEVFERKKTTPPEQRLKHIQYLKNKEVNVGVNGEPFIPGVHTLKNFKETMKILKSYGIPSYNTYNFHFNDFVAKKLNDHTSVDIEKIWFYNQDAQWKPILQKLISIAKKFNIRLGCPDFVNSEKHIEKANTCCGVNVPNPCTFNTHTWKQLCQKKEQTVSSLMDQTWDGSGELEKGKAVMSGTTKDFYTLKDAGIHLC